MIISGMKIEKVISESACWVFLNEVTGVFSLNCRIRWVKYAANSARNRLARNKVLKLPEAG
jgi:hypothetical protein